MSSPARQYFPFGDDVNGELHAYDGVPQVLSSLRLRVPSMRTAAAAGTEFGPST